MTTDHPARAHLDAAREYARDDLIPGALARLADAIEALIPTEEPARSPSPIGVVHSDHDDGRDNIADLAAIVDDALADEVDLPGWRDRNARQVARAVIAAGYRPPDVFRVEGNTLGYPEEPVTRVAPEGSGDPGEPDLPGVAPGDEVVVLHTGRVGVVERVTPRDVQITDRDRDPASRRLIGRERARRTLHGRIEPGDEVVGRAGTSYAGVLGVAQKAPWQRDVLTVDWRNGHYTIGTDPADLVRVAPEAPGA